jgi:hypothetical protein
MALSIPLPLPIRLAACATIKTRFAGRAALEKQAKHDPVALAWLEVQLGLASESDVLAAEREVATERLLTLARNGSRRIMRLGDAADEALVPTGEVTLDSTAQEALGYLLAGDDYAARERLAAIRYASTGPFERDLIQQVARLVAPAACTAIDQLRAARRALALLTDPLASRDPGHAARVVAYRRLREAVAGSGLRETRHGHEALFVVVGEGHEGATSSTCSVRPADVGLGAAYARQAYWVTTSRHEWRGSVAILRPAVRALNIGAPVGVVYLSETCRVRQGAGTALVTERLTGTSARGKQVWS